MRSVSERYGKYRKGDRVRDFDGIVWCCEKGGRPGHWEREATGE